MPIKSYRNPKILKAARGRDCTAQIAGVCNHNPETTVAAHSNMLLHGRGFSHKSYDWAVAYMCSACHAWYDSGTSPKREKEIAFLYANAVTLRFLFNEGIVG